MHGPLSFFARFDTARAGALQGAHTFSALFLASAALLAITACGPSDPLEEVRLLQDVSGDYEASIEPLRELLQTRPDEPEVHYRYGTALLATGEQGMAMWSLKRAMESPEWRAKAGLPLAATLISTGAHDDAVEVCDLLLEDDPDDVPTLLMRANARMHGRRDYEGSLADAERVLELDPDNENALVPRAVALLAMERVEEAAEALEDLEGLYRDESLGLQGSSGLCVARATFALEKKEIELAEERFETCLEAFPTDSIVLNAGMKFFDSLGRVERSDEILADGLALSPESYTARSTLALRLLNRGKVEEARALLREGTELDSPAAAAEAWAGYASFEVDQGEYDEAVAAYAKARSLQVVESPQLLLAHADALVLAERFDEARKLIQEIELPAHQYLLEGRIALQQDDPASALEHFEEGIQLWPNNAVARYYSAIAAERLGDFERAIEDYRYAMRIDTAATDAYLRLARLHEAAGRYEAALTALSFKPGGRPEELDAAMLHLRLLARVGRAKNMPKHILTIVRRPENWGTALAALGAGVRARAGSEGAIEVIRTAEGVDLENPRQVDALEAVVSDLAAVGKSSEGVELAKKAIAAHPDAAAFHAVHGQALRSAGASADAVRAAFEKALALDPDEIRALVGLGELELKAGNREAALAHFDRARELDPDDRAAARAAAGVVASLDRKSEAEQRLASLLEAHPYDAEAARTLAEMRDARGVRDERTLELARRAVAFGGGEEAESLATRLGASS